MSDRPTSEAVIDAIQQQLQCFRYPAEAWTDRTETTLAPVCSAHRHFPTADGKCPKAVRVAEAVTAVIRDAIHRDGPDADAIRDALGLGWEGRIEPDAHGGIIDFMGQVRMIAKQPTIRRRVVSDWRTQP